MMDNKLKELLSTPPITIPLKDIKDEDFHTFLTEKHGEKAEKFIKWAKNTELQDKISPRQLEQLVSMSYNQFNIDLLNALKIDQNVIKDMLVFLVEENTNNQLPKILEVREKMQSPEGNTSSKKNNM
jgi:ABC-type antimicrobial peptide transport system permease subunit